MKDIYFIGSAQKDLKGLPEAARREAGHQLHRVQCGLEPSDWKPMTSIGKGVREIRVQIDGQFRIIYLANIAGAIYVLHAFTKKTQKTTQKDIDLAKARYKEVTRS
ncbi:MAG: type II toxin-antitoxin system RelE/ParE family toxin [Legionellales bacterium]|jgi:phage-related protein